MDVSILVISYNTRELSLACLQSVREQTTGIDFEVIVADNASMDGSADAIAADFPDVRLIRLDQNVGFARGNNLAAREATGAYFLLLNPDTVVLDGAVQKMLAFAQAHPEAGIVGGRTLYGDHRLNPTSCWGEPTLWGMFCYATGLTSLSRGSRLFDSESLGGWARDTVREVGVVTGCLLMIRRELWEKLGGFDPAFFMYGEDADLSLRVRATGAKCLICPDATIIHYRGASERVRADKMVRLFRAKAQLFDKHWSRPAARLGIRLLDLWALTRTTALWGWKIVRPQKAEAYETWRSIWRRRQEWHMRAVRQQGTGMRDSVNA